jgi:hypothetical protein
MALLDHVKDIAFASRIPVDQILGTFSGSLSVNATSTTTFPDKVSASTTVTTNIPERTFFQGVFSTDNGVTWVDFNSNRSIQLGGFANLQTQMVYGRSLPGQLVITGDNWNRTSDGITFTASPVTFLFKVVLFAMPGQGNITPQPAAQQRNFNSQLNYQKIFTDTPANFSWPIGATTATLNHNLGYVPKYRLYISNFSFAADNTALYDFGYFVSQYTIFQAWSDNNTLSLYFDNSSGAGPMTGTIYVRIYYADN